MAGDRPALLSRSRGFEANPSFLATLRFPMGFSTLRAVPRVTDSPKTPPGPPGIRIFPQSQTWALDFLVFLPLFLGQRWCEAPEGLAPELRHVPKTRHQAEHPAPQSPRGESAAGFC